MFLQFYSGPHLQLHSRILWAQRLHHVRLFTCFLHVQPIPQCLIQSSKSYLTNKTSFHIFPVTLSIDPFNLLISFFSGSCTFIRRRHEFSVTHTTGKVILMQKYKLTKWLYLDGTDYNNFWSFFIFYMHLIIVKILLFL
jgi:hypothetical protein